jgi:hypothetical protein
MCRCGADHSALKNHGPETSGLWMKLRSIAHAKQRMYLSSLSFFLIECEG